jgi:hypothetical protein
MLSAELRSPMLSLDSAATLDAVEAELRTVNTLAVWVSAYVGLIGGPEPAPAVLDGLLEVTGLIGEIGWLLDALSDACKDLRANVWSLVWLEVARAAPATWRDSTDTALSALTRSPAIDRLLSRVEIAIREVERQPSLAAASAAKLAALCRLCAWSFLQPRCAEPAS